jgi:hypothetical protein
MVVYTDDLNETKEKMNSPDLGLNFAQQFTPETTGMSEPQVSGTSTTHPEDSDSASDTTMTQEDGDNAPDLGHHFGSESIKRIRHHYDPRGWR